MTLCIDGTLAHRWSVAGPDGLTLHESWPAVCKRCGATREYPIFVEGAPWGGSNRNANAVAKHEPVTVYRTGKRRG